SPSDLLQILLPTDYHHAWTQPSQVGKWLTLLCHHPHRRINPIPCRRHLILPFYPGYYHLNHSIGIEEWGFSSSSFAKCME
ncbi:hypothetical protein PSHT_16225, partial [Puccinia striiformis]